MRSSRGTTGSATACGSTGSGAPSSTWLRGWRWTGSGTPSSSGTPAARELLWVRQVGTDAGEQASGVAVDPRGDIDITGFSERTLPGSVEANRGGSDVFVAKFDTSGQQAMYRTWPTAG